MDELVEVLLAHASELDHLDHSGVSGVVQPGHVVVHVELRAHLFCCYCFSMNMILLLQPPWIRIRILLLQPPWI